MKKEDLIKQVLKEVYYEPMEVKEEGCVVFSFQFPYELQDDDEAISAVQEKIMEDFKKLTGSYPLVMEHKVHPDSMYDMKHVVSVVTLFAENHPVAIQYLEDQEDDTPHCGGCGGDCGNCPHHKG